MHLIPSVFYALKYMQVGTAWERAVGTLKAVLDAAFQGATAAAAMLTVKDFMVLVCLALGERPGPPALRLLATLRARLGPPAMPPRAGLG